MDMYTFTCYAGGWSPVVVNFSVGMYICVCVRACLCTHLHTVMQVEEALKPVQARKKVSIATASYTTADV